MKKREFICALCLSAVLSMTGASAVCAVELADEEIQAVAADSSAEMMQEAVVADSSSSESGGSEGVQTAAENDSFIIEEPGSSPGEDVQPGENIQSGEDTPEDEDLSIDLIIEEETVVEDPGMVDSRKIEEGVEDLAKEQEDALVPDLFRSNVAYNISEVMSTMYSWLRNTLGFNHAAACGVLANIQYESGFNPGAIGDSGSSYGLCQWRNGRRQSLVGYCLSRELSFTSVEGQLAYLGCEMAGDFRNVYGHLYNVPDTPEGAYDAASFWCRYFEMPSHTAAKALERGEFAANVLFWKDFSSSAQGDSGAAEAEDPQSSSDDRMDELQVVYTAVISSAMEEGGTQLIQNVKECYSAVDNAVQTGKAVYSYLENKFYIPEATVAAGIKDLVTGGYSRYEQMLSDSAARFSDAE